MRSDVTRRILSAGGALAAALLSVAAAPGPGRAQEAAGPEWDCFRSWTVRTMKQTGAFRVDRAPWALRWRRTTPTHSDLDGLFAELHRVEDGEKTEDQVEAVNTDHDGHEGTITIGDRGAFWLDLESWSEETAWEIEACVPAKETG